MTQKVQEVYNQSEDAPAKLFGLWCSQGSHVEVAKANRNLLPLSAFLAAAADVGELSTPGATLTTLTLRYDYMVPEDTLLKKFVATIQTGTIPVGANATGQSVEIQLLYTPPNSAVTQTIYDETVTSAFASAFGSTTVFDFHLPPRPLQALLAKGGIITVVLIASATGPGGGGNTVQVEVFARRNSDCSTSYLSFDFAALNTSKDMEALNERLPT